MLQSQDSSGWQGSLQLPPEARIKPSSKGIVVFSGGSAANSLVDVFNGVAENNASTLSYVIPISDNGGSSSELIRVFGGPGIGDLRSRLVRLIPDNGDPNSEAGAIKELFNHRLPKDCRSARQEWLDIIEAQHSIWHNISSPKKELIRSFLNSMNMEIVKRLRPSSRFDFSGASIGNLFLTGARLFSGSLESAIYLLSSVCSVPASISVLPVINTSFTHHISAGLSDGSVITGQNNISHPSAPIASLPIEARDSPTRILRETEEQDKVEDANLPGTLPSLRKPAIQFSKDDEESLPARISRIWYINPYGAEITLPANSRVLAALENASCIIYSIGSLFTSIIPSLILRGVGDAVANPTIRSKILILNGSIDRETGPKDSPFSAMDFVAAIADACASSRSSAPVHRPSIPGPSPTPSESATRQPSPSPITTFSEPSSYPYKVPRSEYWQYVTHIIYIEGEGTPKVDRALFAECGIECLRLYGRKGGDGTARYDAKALAQALEMVLGRRDFRRDQTRRNTLER
ncbi:hypothetical protein H2203_002016 [Taxawa tesnikishii (nom. ined.)]|nr:hypothetical protein H2203_002016 [Dothideales sp. JES 119]